MGGAPRVLLARGLCWAVQQQAQGTAVPASCPTASQLLGGPKTDCWGCHARTASIQWAVATSPLCKPQAHKCRAKEKTTLVSPCLL